MWLDTIYHATNPVAFALGPLTVRWYGLAYLAGFVCAGLVMMRTSRRWRLGLTSDEVLNIVVGVAFGVIVGARLGYVLFYGAGYYLANPIKILAFNEGGMSFHGGLVGAIVGGALVCRQMRISIPTVCDLAVIGAPIGLFFGRCANFINGELWGKPTDLPWGVMFSNTGGGYVYRHPSQLYEAILEGIVIFVVLYALSRRVPPRPQGTFLGTFLALYGCFRFLIEFVRMPDSQLGYLLGTGWLTMGQCLSVPLAILGVVLVVWAHRLDRPQVGHLESARG
ncbi:prolipoprotein diacylglyceryl transferase [Olsenella porci]|jgi:phosphatidylglycerol:prolipoprotein diacylglycerol transferase|uniref:Phosphatidylglycerol--prolipoprotein diacylglyceryl transferase n=1 Tax=Olsenella porci TaxID=2652279 RepID=A0A6N7XNV8_9ACTN|nr:prolipoprotein diacylglyceryl transferase [Olsenella porci]MST72654.1 prolipoprotein diacylglyceryl transferase [Olsenella porci]